MRNENYFESPYPYFDELIISDFSDETSQVNALLSGSADVVNALSAASIATIGKSGNAKTLISKGGGITPFTIARRCPAVQRRTRPASAPTRRRPSADARSGLRRERSARQRHFEHLRPGVRQGDSATGTGHRPSQVSLEEGRPGGTHDRARDGRHRSGHLDGRPGAGTAGKSRRNHHQPSHDDGDGILMARST